MQKISNTSYQSIIILLSISILLTGCHSYYTIPKDDYTNVSKMEDIKIVYTNGKEFIVEKNDTTEVKIVGDSLIVYEGTNQKIIQMNEVDKIKENRFDLGGTITIILVPLIILAAYFFANFSFY